MDADTIAMHGVRAAEMLQGPGANASSGISKQEGDAMNDPVVVDFIEYYYKGEPMRGDAGRAGDRRGEGDGNG